MPQFEVKEVEGKEVGRATFHKESDYKTVILNDDKLKKPRLLHVIHADKLIELKRATEVKGSKAEKREIETVETPAPKNK